MKLVIGESEYDINESLNYATLGALDDLQEQSSTAKFDGITQPFIIAAFSRAGEMIAKGERIDGDRDFRRALMGVVFLSRRHAGETVEFEDVRKLPYLEAKLRLSEKELAAGEVPKESGAAGSPEPQ